MAAAAAENQQNWDEIDRALDRAGATHDGNLARETRSEIWRICGASMETSDRDAKLDQFINAQKGNPRFDDSFVAPPRSAKEPERSKQYDMLRLDETDFEDIASGKLSVEKTEDGRLYSVSKPR